MGSLMFVLGWCAGLAWKILQVMLLVWLVYLAWSGFAWLVMGHPFQLVP
jgi:hypothetical protein